MKLQNALFYKSEKYGPGLNPMKLLHYQKEPAGILTLGAAALISLAVLPFLFERRGTLLRYSKRRDRARSYLSK